MPPVATTGKWRACKIIKDIPSGRRGPPNRLLLHTGDLVWMKEDGGKTDPADQSNTGVWIQNVHKIGNIEPHTNGYVPLDHLEIGEYNRHGNYPVHVDFSFNQDVTINRQAPTFLQATIEAVLRGMGSEHQRLRDVGFDERIMDRIVANPQQLAQRIVGCKYSF
jgi:hypothetical protein